MLALLVTFAVAAAQPPFSCAGPYVPPTDFDERGDPVIMEFAVATAPSTSPRAHVEDLAREQLVQRLCRLADRASCAPLAAAAKQWAFAKDGDRMCAMAVLRAPDLEAWRTQLAPNLDDELVKAMALLLPPAETTKSLLTGKTKVKKRAAIVVVGSIEDNGAPGGVRADWLLGRVRLALGALDVEMREAPRGWNGERLPKDVELVIRGNIVERVDTKRQLPILEASFVSVDGKGVTRPAKPVTLPAALAPAAPRPVTTPPVTAGLSLHAEARASGSLCPGDYTQIHVTNESDVDLYVRVFNLDANGEVLLLFPSETRADDRVPAGKTVSLSEDGFTVEGEPGARERYVAIASRTPDGLGRFSEMRGTCRFKPDDARALWSGQRLDAAYRATAGFTLLDDVRCRKPIALPDRQLVAQGLADIPWCPTME